MLRYFLIFSLTFLNMVAQAKQVAKDKTKTSAANPNLEDQLKALDAENKAPVGANREKMYAVQTRYLPLKFKTEATVGGAYNLTGDSFLRTEQFEVGLRFHFSDRWAIGAS